ncbi:F-box/kelch-repeat protein At3g23880-like isoform X2 [Rhododendron vialii]|uniref:F-box/kelch-repeat protein At3g23880-like isoform X2 n=1 Tax=Rhododendron vialii TaxID=182163 RepID=UPI00265FE5C0|nr:F-box/kelch-repeat protein At3g23880-like isoform X2 [Rhododendron vialii]
MSLLRFGHTGLKTTSYTGLKTCSLETLDSVLEYQLWENVVDLNYPFDDFNQFVVIVGSCNGLMCVASNTRALYLLNPSTKKSKRLPDSGVKRGWHPQDAYGFGFDESNDDYKVVLILYDRGGGFSADSNVMVYTLRTDSWRKIGGLSCGIPFGVLGKFLNGSIHWVVCDKSGSSCSYVIVSIDLEKEAYGEVLPPTYGDGFFNLELYVLKGSLGVLCRCRENYTDVWIIKEYGKIDPWTKLFTLQEVAEPRFGQFSTTVCTSNNGELLILYRLRFSIYSPKNGTFRNPIFHNVDPWPCLQMCTYVESLVSPNADNLVQRQHQ